MSNELVHSKSSVKRWGGKIEDYIAIHELIDSPKACMNNNSSRLVTHNQWFIYTIIPKVFGYFITNSDNKQVDTRDIAALHVLEDFRMKFIPTLENYLTHMTLPEWIHNGVKDIEDDSSKQAAFDFIEKLRQQPEIVVEELINKENNIDEENDDDEWMEEDEHEEINNEDWNNDEDDENNSASADELSSYWKTLNIERIVYSYSGGGDSMDGSEIKIFCKDDSILEEHALHNIVDNIIFDNFNFYFDSDGHYIGEYGTVTITKEINEDGEEGYLFKKENNERYNESEHNLLNISLTEDEYFYLNTYVDLSSISVEDETQISIKNIVLDKDAFVFNKSNLYHSKMLTNLCKKINNKWEVFRDNNDEIDVNDYSGLTFKKLENNLLVLTVHYYIENEIANEDVYFHIP